MKIILIGAGKIGLAIAKELTGEGHDMTVVDSSELALAHANDLLDVMTIQGNGAAASVLLQAGVRDADVVLAVTAVDEVNLICSLMAKKMGAAHTVARVRNPEYSRDAQILRREIGLDLIINPEQVSAQEIARILRVPSAFGVENFAGGTVELIGFQVMESDGICGKPLSEYNRQNPNNLLLCAAKRGEEIIVPDGNFVPQNGDKVYVIGSPAETLRVFRSMGRSTAPLKHVSVIGGGALSEYLAHALRPLDARICIVERSEAKCRRLSEVLPQCSVIWGDGTDPEFLDSEGIFDTDALVAVTGSDEENLLISLSAMRRGVKKALPKMSHATDAGLLHDLGVNTVISPARVIGEQLASYVRSLANSQGSAVDCLYKILGGAMEAVEFRASAATHFLNRPLRDLPIRKGLIIAAIVHNGVPCIPDGNAVICEDDRVIVVAKSLFLRDLNDILEL